MGVSRVRVRVVLVVALDRMLVVDIERLTGSNFGTEILDDSLREAKGRMEGVRDGGGLCVFFSWFCIVEVLVADSLTEAKGLTEGVREGGGGVVRLGAVWADGLCLFVSWV